MSRIGKHRRITGCPFLFFAASLFIGLSLPAQGQYVGRVDTDQNGNKPTLRATAVLEYTGDLTKPTASRLIPIAVWDGERYQPGGLYLAQPVPLTVETGTQYVLQVAGMPKGLFDVKAASDAGGSWIAIGNYQKPTPPSYAKLHRSRTLPRIFVEDDKPHFAHVPAGDTNPGSGTTKTTASNTSQASAPDTDSERPTLHRRTGDESSQTTASDSSTASSSAPSVDPDRPILREPTKSATSSNGTSNSNTAPGGESPETATTATDPNRPHLEYGRPENPESLDAETKAEIARLASHPENLEQIVAVSDATNRPPRSYAYSWTDPEDQQKMKAALETIAQHLLANSEQNVTPTAANSSATRRTPTSKAHRKLSPPAPPTLTDEQFSAYALSYGSGATLVFSATTGSGNDARYITLIAQPDFNGTPLVLFKQITSERELNIIPRMKLIDAVDTDADNRAELIFALENQTGRQYAIYRVANNRVEQIFATGG